MSLSEQTMTSPISKTESASDKIIMLENIKKDTNMTWEMFTNADYRISVVLKDDTREYVDSSTQGIPHKVLSEGYSKIEGDNLRLIINIETPDGRQLSTPRYFVLPYSVPRSEDGTIAGQGYNIMMEDSSDGDYNDLMIFIHSCKSRY